MKLKFKYETKEQIPAEYLPLYSENEGGWRLDVEGAVDKTRLDEFRENNLSLLKERDDLKTRYDGIDAGQARARQTEKAGLEAERQRHVAEFDTAVQTRVAALKEELEQKITGLVNERDTLQTRLVNAQIEHGLSAAAARRNARPAAMADIAARARAALAILDGVPTFVAGDGKTPRLGRDGTRPMTFEEWMDTQVAEAPHLFEANAGGGAAGNSSGGGGTAHLPARNPFRKETWNLTEQMRLRKTDPQLAARLKSAATPGCTA